MKPSNRLWKRPFLSDAIIHVIDVSNDEWRHHKQVTEEVLKELGAGDKPVLLVYNKIDKLDDPEDFRHFLDREDFPIVLISAHTGQGREELEEGFKPHSGSRTACKIFIDSS